jgi:hypothetical protein
MKKIIIILSAFFSLFTGCKKSSDSISYETKISFTYNGQQYNHNSSSNIMTDVILVQGIPLFVNFTGIEIGDPGLLGGTIIILSRSSGNIQCSYLRPTGMLVSSSAGNCNLTNGGNPIDSVQVYWYESGSINFSYSDCRNLTGATIPGQKDCKTTGSFDLILTNKNNQKIKLTNGSFTGRIKTYP